MVYGGHTMPKPDFFSMIKRWISAFVSQDGDSQVGSMYANILRTAIPRDDDPKATYGGEKIFEKNEGTSVAII